MEFIDKIKDLSNRIKELKDKVQTEEATKHSFVMPFISLLGYDVFNPNIVIPEFTADIGKKKGEKVDYAILREGIPIILIEVKTHTEQLDKHDKQLERYYTVTDSKFGILTNGIEYRFYSDMEKTNKMDTKPFLVIDLLNIKDRDIKELEKFTKENLDIEKILNMANKQKYVTLIKQIFKKETLEPSDELARFFALQSTERMKTQAVIDEFKGYIKTAFGDIINDMAQEKINSLKSQLSVEINKKEDESLDENDDGVITTEEETEGFFIVKSILAETTELARIFGRDTKSYFGVLLDNNNRKWICRLRFNTSQKYISLHEVEKEETKYSISKLEDIYLYKEKIKEIVARLEKHKES
ncbi:MAG: type I restriction endonuclease [Arcobacteraceae bacterium]